MEDNCSSAYYDYGVTDSSKFGNPLPWIGLYIAAASLVCLVLMVVDLFNRSKWRKRWVGSKFFAFNATTLTLLAVATKLPSDITGAMPGLVDQLAKLSGICLLCVGMDHAMPSLVVMDGLEACSNTIAIGIMVVSMFVNIWLQLGTGLISNNYFRYIYGCYSLSMMLLLLFLVSHSLTISASRRILYRQYYVLHEELLSEIFSCVDVRDRFSDGKLEEYISKYWLMALTSSPDYALRTSELAIVSTYLTVFLYYFAFIYGTFFFKAKRHLLAVRCFEKSDYKWSTSVVFTVQLFANGVGYVGSCRRRLHYNPLTAWRNLFKKEKCRYELMSDWKDRPLPAWISDKRIRQAMRNLRGMLLDVLIKLQFLVIIISRIVLLLCSFFEFIVHLLRLPLLRIFQKSSNRHNGTTNARDMSRYVLYLEDEVDMEKSKVIARKYQKHPTTWIDRGRANQPTNLDRLLRNNSLPEAFGAVREFYSKQITPAGSSREPPNCWALPIVTLASILYAASPHREQFMLAVGESLRYTRLVDENMDERGTRRMQKAADIAWEKLYLQNQWMNFDLDYTNSRSFSHLINNLHKEAEKHIQKDEQSNSWKYWPRKVFIANCMYTTTELILDRQTGGYPRNLIWSVERLEKVMVGLLGACLTNLSFCIFKHCSSGTFGLREGKVREAATILGETRAIVTLLEDTGRAVNYPEHKEYFESWCGRSPFPQSYV